MAEITAGIQQYRLSPEKPPFDRKLERARQTHMPLSHSRSFPRSLVPFHFVEQVARKRGAGPAFLGHPLATGCFETEDAVFPGHVAGDRNTSFPGIRRRGSAPSNGNTSTTILRAHVLNCLSRSVGVPIKRSLRGSAVALHGIRCGAVTAVHTTMLAQEVIIRRIGLVSRAAREGVGHGESARHCGELSTEIRSRSGDRGTTRSSVTAVRQRSIHRCNSGREANRAGRKRK